VAVDGQAVGPSNFAARDLVTEIAALGVGVRPDEIGTPWPIQSPGFFSDQSSVGSLHLAFEAPGANDAAQSASAMAPGAAGSSVPGGALAYPAGSYPAVIYPAEPAAGALPAGPLDAVGTPAVPGTAAAQLQVGAKAVNDAAAAGAPAAAQKLLRMLHFVNGAGYSVANHDAINEDQFSVKARGTDCSGLISWLMGPQGLGIWHTSLATPDIANAPGLQAGEGRMVTVWNNKQPGATGHVFIQIGNAYFASEGGGVGVH
jgi:cell wall-associated NlpC family hydrolase